MTTFFDAFAASFSVVMGFVTGVTVAIGLCLACGIVAARFLPTERH